MRRQDLWTVGLIVALVGAIIAVANLVFGWEWTALWDWLPLAIVAVVLLAWVAWYYQLRYNRELEIRERSSQDEALQRYLDQMSAILSKGVSRGSDLEKLHIQIAQARTIAILLNVSPSRKRVPLKLVYEMGLLNRNNGFFIELKSASLDHANFRELALRDADLSRADLRATDLRGADLKNTYLNHADLRGTNLALADLSGANLTGANFLPYDARDPERLNSHNLARIAFSREDLRPRMLMPGSNRLLVTFRDHWWPTVTQLTSTNLQRANLAGTRLYEANLGGADLTRADLNGADLRWANLHYAKLKQANLEGADLEGANLVGVTGVTNEALERQARSLKGATLPSGQKYEDWLRTRERRKELT